MAEGLSPFEINRAAREQEEAARRHKQAIERTARSPDVIHTIVNCGIGVAEGEQGRSVLQLVQANGEQVHVVLSPRARGALLRELQAAETAGGENGAGPGGAVELG